MTRILCLFFLLVTLSAVAGAETLYRLSPGDTIAISVFEEPELSFKSVRIPSDGVISYPLIGEVSVASLTVRELERSIHDRLLDGYLQKPVVTVSVLEYRPVYVGGAVNNPGEHRYTVGMSVEKAVAVAGGYLESANRAGITIYRKAKNSNPYQVDLNYEVRPGDVVTVPVNPVPNQDRTLYVYLYGQV
ncbi:MAG: polysaccharide export protein, partial [Gammaproteobacteria bacterium]|nr:polysaccharide export protein [Gammaproteobacteria bacterium]